MAQTSRQIEYGLIQFLDNSADLTGSLGSENLRTFTRDTKLFYYWDVPTQSWILEPGNSVTGIPNAEVTIDITGLTSITVPQVDVINLTSSNITETLITINGVVDYQTVKLQPVGNLIIIFQCASDISNPGAGQIVMPSDNFSANGNTSDWFFVEGYQGHVRQIDAMSYGIVTGGYSRLAIVNKSNNPTSTDLPAGFMGVFKNSTSGHINFWVNDGGVLTSLQIT